MRNKELKDEERTPCEIWTRVMGYFRPIYNFNKGKKSEYDDRKCFREPNQKRVSKRKSKRKLRDDFEAS